MTEITKEAKKFLEGKLPKKITGVEKIDIRCMEGYIEVAPIALSQVPKKMTALKAISTIIDKSCTTPIMRGVYYEVDAQTWTKALIATDGRVLARKSIYGSKEDYGEKEGVIDPKDGLLWKYPGSPVNYPEYKSVLLNKNWQGYMYDITVKTEVLAEQLAGICRANKFVEGHMIGYILCGSYILYVEVDRMYKAVNFFRQLGSETFEMHISGDPNRLNCPRIIYMDDGHTRVAVDHGCADENGHNAYGRVIAKVAGYVDGKDYHLTCEKLDELIRDAEAREGDINTRNRARADIHRYKDLKHGAKRGIINDIVEGTSTRFSLGHFHPSNAADRTLSYYAMEDIMTVYHMSMSDAADVYQLLCELAGQ